MVMIQKPSSNKKKQRESERARKATMNCIRKLRMKRDRQKETEEDGMRGSARDENTSNGCANWRERARARERQSLILIEFKTTNFLHISLSTEFK